MITRLWFALGLIWMMFICLITPWGRNTPDNQALIFGFALAPFGIGLLMRLIFRYTVYGPRMRP